eukprot:TRINITY_DN4241_c0_g1_i3.p1 TRINITY_DN4241_c0_g1~~TRINITY_DN4241_c0_g1_i3.p1  ORF type:complete len:127 (+),score=9.29 TRINITY_DN4241_c0_g1_i3:476-856(+)
MHFYNSSQSSENCRNFIQDRLDFFHRFHSRTQVLAFLLLFKCSDLIIPECSLSHLVALLEIIVMIFHFLFKKQRFPRSSGFVADLKRTSCESIKFTLLFLGILNKLEETEDFLCESRSRMLNMYDR